MYKLGIIIGRFQPLHNGHVELIREALFSCEQVLLFIGSSNKLTNFNNPLTWDQRHDSIKAVFPEEPKLKIKGLNDKPNIEDWVASVIGEQVSAADVDPSGVAIFTSDKDEEFYKEHFLYTTEVVESGGLNATDVRAVFYKGYIDLALSYLPLETQDNLKAFLDTAHFERMTQEYFSCTEGKAKALLSHAFGNPIEPVAHAVVIQDAKVLLVKRNSVRGFGQWALPGGFMESNESSRDAALRELKEETGVNLHEHQAVQLAYCVEENMDDLSVRTLGINYLFGVHPDDKLVVTLDPNECLEYEWASLEDILLENRILFYNHNVVVQRLISTAQAQEENQ